MRNLWCTCNKLVFDGIQLVVSTTILVVYEQLQVSQRAFDNIVPTVLVRPTHEVCWQHGDNDKVDHGGLVRSFAFYGSVGLFNILYVQIHALRIEIKLYQL